MASKISALLPAPAEITIAEGKPKLVLRHLELGEIVRMLFSFQDSFVSLYVEAQKETPEFTQFLTLAPDLCARVIATAAGEEQEAEEYRKLPFAVQLIALETLWKISVPDPKAFGETLKRLMNELRRLSEQAEKLGVEVQNPQSEKLPSSSSTNTSEATSPT